jgi:ATP-dependent DNA ligase
VFHSGMRVYALCAALDGASRVAILIIPPLLALWAWIVVVKPPAGPDWVHEIKHDGYRLIARRAIRPCVCSPAAYP